MIEIETHQGTKRVGLRRAAVHQTSSTSLQLTDVIQPKEHGQSRLYYLQAWPIKSLFCSFVISHVLNMQPWRSRVEDDRLSIPPPEDLM